MHPYADWDKIRKRSSSHFKDVSPKLLKFKCFSSAWSQIRQKNAGIAELTHTRYRYFIETKVSKFCQYESSFTFMYLCIN
jgi:hypothetical protein